MSNFPPLSGALLISNPRKEMSLALSNPNDRRRINKLARIAVKTGESPAALVQQWLASRSLPKKQRPEKFQRGGKIALEKALAAPRGTALERAKRALKYAQSKRAVAAAFEAADPEHYKVQKGPFGRKRSYTTRAVAGHARRYLLRRKREDATFFGGTLKSQRVRVPGLRSAKGAKKRVLPKGEGKKLIARWASESKKAGGGKARAGRQSVKRPMNEGLREYRSLMAKARAAGHKLPKGTSLKELRDVRHAVANPGSALIPMGDLALTNPTLGGLKSYLVGYSIPVAIAGGVAGGVHAMAASAGVTEKISSTVGMVPVVGSYLQKAPFTIQGVLVGGAAALAAGVVGGQAGKYLALAGGAAIVFGGGIDAFNYLSGSSDESDIDSSVDEALSQAGLEGASATLNDLALMNSMGDLALTNMGALALGNSSDLGDGFAYEVAPLTASVDGSADYGQASLADAQFCGADFSMQEGSAIVNGRESFLGCYGSPTRRAGVVHSGPSHMAGRPGHRWGWLIKVVGWRRAAIIAALPPAKRVKVLRQIRLAAVKAFNRSAAQWASSQSVPSNGPAVDTTGTVTSVPEGLPAAGLVTGGAEGATGVGGFLGDPALFMGA